MFVVVVVLLFSFKPGIKEFGLRNYPRAFFLFFSGGVSFNWALTARVYTIYYQLKRAVNRYLRRRKTAAREGDIHIAGLLFWIKTL